jgi:hypothetical protein
LRVRGSIGALNAEIEGIGDDGVEDFDRIFFRCYWRDVLKLGVGGREEGFDCGFA